MIVRRIAQTRDLFVAAPQLLARVGPPRNLEDLRRRFPASSLINAETGRSWGWPVNDGLHLTPALPRFASNDPCSELAAALAGRVCALHGHRGGAERHDATRRILLYVSGILEARATTSVSLRATLQSRLTLAAPHRQ